MCKVLLHSIMFLSLLNLHSCSTGKNSGNNSSESSLSSRSYDVLAIAYFQRAQEVRALQYQAYNVATQELSEIVKKGHKKNPAVILDLDETVLDNSPAQARATLRSTFYPTGWDEWIAEAKAILIPGAKDFIEFAQSKNVKVFYISNREKKHLEATLKNMMNLGIKVEADDLLLREDTSSKDKRRAKVNNKFNTLLFIGDNLNDFSGKFEKKLDQERTFNTDSSKDLFGTKFIILPNSMYGDWEGALYHYKFPATAKEREDILKKSLREE